MFHRREQFTLPYGREVYGVCDDDYNSLRIVPEGGIVTIPNISYWEPGFTPVDTVFATLSRTENMVYDYIYPGSSAYATKVSVYRFGCNNSCVLSLFRVGISSIIIRPRVAQPLRQANTEVVEDRSEDGRSKRRLVMM